MDEITEQVAETAAKQLASVLLTLKRSGDFTDEQLHMVAYATVAAEMEAHIENGTSNEAMQAVGAAMWRETYRRVPA